VRIALLATGTVLWGVVFVWLWKMWNDVRELQRQQQKSPAVPQTEVPKFQPYPVPEFELTDQRGRIVTREMLLGRPWVASFIFTRCTGQCPVINRNMKKLQEAVRDTDARLVSITVDPEHDTPEVLKRFAQRHGADPDRWLFLTGPRDDVYRLIDDGFRLSVSENTGMARRPGQEVNHSRRVLLVDASGRVVETFFGTDELEMEKLRQTLRRQFRRRKAHGPRSKTDGQRPGGPLQKPGFSNEPGF